MRRATPVLMTALLLVLPVMAQAGFEMRGGGVASTGDVIRHTEEGDMPAHKVDAVEAVPVGPAPIEAPVPLTDAQITTAPVEMADSMNNDASVVTGFGSDLPLAIALQQIVPSDHQVSFAPEVDAGEIVSWQGGQPWPDVARAMLSSVGMAYDLKDGHVIHIKKAGDHQMPSAQAILAEGTPPTPVAVSEPPAPPSPPVASAPEQSQPEQAETVEVRRTKPSTLWNRMKTSLETDLIREPEPSKDVAASTPVVPESWKSGSEMPASGNWQVSEGENLSAVLQRWSEQEGIEFRWQPNYDYKLKKSASFGGDYASAVTRLLDEFAELSPRPTAQLYANPAHPRMLVVR